MTSQEVRETLSSWASSRFGGIVTIVLFLIAQGVLMLIWAAKQEARITALEVAEMRLDALHNGLSTALGALDARIDRLDTPLARKVEVDERRIEANQVRIQALSERLQRLETLIETLRQQR